MKPRIRFSWALGCWVVRLPMSWTVPCDVVCETWPKALAWLGIPCPEGWQS